MTAVDGLLALAMRVERYCDAAGRNPDLLTYRSDWTPRLDWQEDAALSEDVHLDAPRFAALRVATNAVVTEAKVLLAMVGRDGFGDQPADYANRLRRACMELKKVVAAKPDDDRPPNLARDE